ncbi:MAG: MarR family transcriptional regulator [Pseudomonadota bacterium]
MTKPESAAEKPETGADLRHWQEAGFDDRLAHLVKDATRALVRALQVRLIEHGVSFGQWTFLRILWQSDGLTQRALSELAGVMEPTTYTALLALEKLGLITRRQLADNKKNSYVFLTPQGRALEEKLVPLAVEVNAISVQGLKESEIKTARKVLLAIIDNLASDEIASTNSERRMPSTRELGRLVAEGATRKTKRA